MRLLDLAGWIVFLGLGPILWASGIRLFLRSPLSRPRKVGWTLLLITTGAVIGGLLSLPQIRNRFLVLLVTLPILAVADVQLARSNRSFSFWLRACAFEICTVFATAATARFTIDRLVSGN